MYDNPRDVDFRLRGTLVEYKGELRYVDGFDGENEVYKLHLRGVREDVRLDSRYLKITNIRTGYMNINGHLVYLSRRPTRAYRQGLRQDNTTCYGDLSLNDVIRCIHGGVDKDKPLPNGYKILSKDYAVKGTELYYRNRLVGIYHEGKPYLSNDKKFLIESLEESCCG